MNEPVDFSANKSTERSTERLIKDPKFLQKCWDFAKAKTDDPIPRGLESHWRAICWFEGVICALAWAGYEIVPKPTPKENPNV